MEREEFNLKLKQIAKETEITRDDEKGWSDAHYLVCDFLEQLGYQEEADIFRCLFWYG
ncbi:hypothetical protein [Megamonas sp.]